MCCTSCCFIAIIRRSISLFEAVNYRELFMNQSHTIEKNLLKQVIVVEGDSSLRRSMVNHLMLDGYTVTGVGSAYDFYRQVFEEPYALAIIDSDLFDQNGLVVAEYARKNTDIRIITLSEPLTSSTIPANIKAGADLNLVKPIDLRLLGAAVRTLLSRLGTHNGHHLSQKFCVKMC